MRTRFVVAAALALAAPASAQVTRLGGGTAPLFVSGSPTLGGTLSISPLFAPLPLVILGLSRVDLPLASLGASCPDVLIPNLDFSNYLNYTLPIPNDPVFVGATVYAQGAMVGVAPCRVFGVYVAMTEAVEIRVQ
ncbi:MAG: hypothetical protein AB7O97_22450 [Planctomycetota bacterium]